VKIADALNGVTRLAFDTAPIIYLVENNPAYVNKVDLIIDYVDQGRLSAITSTLTLAEVLVLPKRVGDAVAETAFKQILMASRNFSMLPIDAVVADMAASLRAKYSLRTPDALQVGTAIVNRCEALLTNDNGLKRVSELSILVLDELEL
jgi:predicted nucleic acid-binding protein